MGTQNSKNIFFYYEIIKKWKKFILLNVIIITVISLVISLLLPVWYYSYAIIKPEENSGTSLFSAVLGSKGLAEIGKNLNVGGLQYSDLDYYQSLLQSRRITISMIKKFNLKSVYNEKYLFKTINDLLSNSQVQTDPTSNTLIVGVYDKIPIRSKEMVSYYLSLLDSSIKKISVLSLKSNRKIIEERYKKNLRDLDSAQTKLKKFQEKYGVIIPEEQFKSTVEAYANIEAQKLLLESQLSVAENNYNESSPQIKNIQERLKTLNTKLLEFKSKKNNSSRDLFVPLGKAPELIDKYVTLFRNVTIQDKLLELTYPLYQQAIMNEMNDSAPFVVIDHPFIPEYKEKPKRAVIVISGFLLSFILSIFFVFIYEHIKTLKLQYQTNNE